MTAPAVVFPDPMLSVLDVVRPAHATVTFGTKIPSNFDPSTAPSPYCLIRPDFTTTTYPVVENVTIRVSVWATSEASGLALAQRIRATLLTYAGGASIRSIRALTGPLPTLDPDSGAPMSTFTVAVRLRPTPL